MIIILVDIQILIIEQKVVDFIIILIKLQNMVVSYFFNNILDLKH
jgi:hypothetical protein